MMKRLALLLACVCVSALSAGQKAVVSDVLHLKTTIGSFKLINGEGTTTFTFEGTVLLIDVVGDVKIEGTVKKEFEDPKLKRKAYFGKGKMTITGKWRGVQWFGSNMEGVVKGKATVRLQGEFDKDLNTGEYWYGDKVNNKLPWYSTGITVTCPEDLRMNPQPTRRGGYGGG